MGYSIINLNLKSRLTFGKYKGKTIINIIHKGFSRYIFVLFLHNTNIKIAQEVWDYMQKCQTNQNTVTSQIELAELEGLSIHDF